MAKAKLSDPFPSRFVKWKVQATSNDKSKCMLAAYVDPRHYMMRLDEVDPQWTEDIAIYENCTVSRITVNGVTRSSVGESEDGKNSATSAEMQAFKRACAKHGLGRYLYFLPMQWVSYDGKNFNQEEIKPLPEWALPEEEK